MAWRTGTVIAIVLGAIALIPGSAFAQGDPSDFGVTLDGPPSSSVGGTANYEVVVTNAGPGNEAGKVRLTRGRGATNVEQGEALRTTSSTTSQGTCFPDPKGVICRLGQIAPGEKATIKVGVKIFDSDIPKLPIQATVEPDIPGTIDPDEANNHAEIVTSVRAPITVEGIPEGCATKPFSVKVAVDVPKGDETKAIVDGRAVETSSKSKFSFKINTRDLDNGNHSLSIVVQAKKGGPLATLKRKFKTC